VRTRVLVIDNYDSFTYNVVQELGKLGAEPIIFRNDALDVAGVAKENPEAILLSPGPGRPENAGITCEVIETFAGKIPILGICLGHQAIGQVFGMKIISAPTLMHGKTSEIHHDGTGLFAGLSEPFQATRYHSLTIDPATVTDVVDVTAQTADGVIMGIKHKEFDIQGVQFHPESILTPEGAQLLRNFLTGVL
jgi:anthranilate synthase/aminodeoxychorismate synthase-like glutamine amidotransferase